MSDGTVALDAETYRELCLNFLAQIVDPLALALGEGNEVVLHDLSNLGGSVHAIAGGITGRGVGSPPTNLLLRHVRAGATSNIIGYKSDLPGGRSGRSSTIIIKSPVNHEAIAALCLTMDVTHVQALNTLTNSILNQLSHSSVNESTESIAQTSEEVFPHNINSLASAIVQEVIGDAEIPVSLMKKQHKLHVVAELKERGVFQVREAVELVAQSLDVTRFTIYNYLNELQEQDDHDQQEEQEGTA